MNRHDAMEGRGSDSAWERRPGVPMERPPRPDPGAHWTIPERQETGERVLERSGISRVTPVYGTGEPARGLSGWMRRRAYAIPEHFARHWMLLLAADRVDVLESSVRRRPVASILFAGGLGMVLFAASRARR